MKVACAGAIVSRADGRIVVVRRARAPSQGLWSIPGGRVEVGESLAEAARREVLEETGLDIAVVGEAGRVELPAGPDSYVVTDFHATVVGDPDALRAGDDASEARWVTYEEFRGLDTTPGLAAELAHWGVWGV